MGRWRSCWGFEGRDLKGRLPVLRSESSVRVSQMAGVSMTLSSVPSADHPVRLVVRSDDAQTSPGGAVSPFKIESTNRMAWPLLDDFQDR